MLILETPVFMRGEYVINAGEITLSGSGLVSNSGTIHNFVNKGNLTHSGVSFADGAIHISQMMVLLS